MSHAQQVPQLLPLADWATARYGAHAPHINTLRRWAREGRIAPAPEKSGKTYFVEPTAKYQGD